MRRRFTNRIFSQSSTRELGESERSRRCYQRCYSRLRTQVDQAMCTCLPLWFDAMSNVIPSLNGRRQRVEALLHNMVRVEGQEQELANEMSENLEGHTGTMKIPSGGHGSRQATITGRKCLCGLPPFSAFLSNPSLLTTTLHNEKRF